MSIKYIGYPVYSLKFRFNIYNKPDFKGYAFYCIYNSKLGNKTDINLFYRSFNGGVYKTILD